MLQQTATEKKAVWAEWAAFYLSKIHNIPSMFVHTGMTLSKMPQCKLELYTNVCVILGKENLT